jgi:hypothetical protein
LGTGEKDKGGKKVTASVDDSFLFFWWRAL